jgi:xanthine dehydrogenase/oxidase
VKIEYEDLPAILTMDEAIAQESFYHETIHKLDTTRGSRGRYDQANSNSSKTTSSAGVDLEEIFAGCDHVLEGEVRNGGQEHFYLEPQATLCVPGEAGEMTVFSSTQNPTHTQTVVADLLGVAKSEVVTRVRRLGGGFGGKESRSFYVSGAAAVAANALGQPVRMVLDRDVDMCTSGARHPFLSRYRVGFNDQGRIHALDAQLHNDAGYSQDLRWVWVFFLCVFVCLFGFLSLSCSNSFLNT